MTITFHVSSDPDGLRVEVRDGISRLENAYNTTCNVEGLNAAMKFIRGTLLYELSRESQSLEVV